MSVLTGRESTPNGLIRGFRITYFPDRATAVITQAHSAAGATQGIEKLAGPARTDQAVRCRTASLMRPAFPDSCLTVNSRWELPVQVLVVDQYAHPHDRERGFGVRGVACVLCVDETRTFRSPMIFGKIRRGFFRNSFSKPSSRASRSSSRSRARSLTDRGGSSPACSRR
jgi:hypothetical protein